MKLTGQMDESKKAPVDRWTTRRADPSARARGSGGPNQTGTLWKRKMQSLALRLSQHRPRRDRSGAPMRRTS